MSCARCPSSACWHLAVFAGGCTLDAAEAVCAGGGIETDEAVGLFALRFASRSFVVADDTASGDLRYRLLETIRRYGEERQVAEQGETEMLRAANAEYYCQLAAVCTAEMQGPGQIEAGRRFAAEHENLLGALSHAIDTGDVDLALRLSTTPPRPTSCRSAIPYDRQVPRSWSWPGLPSIRCTRTGWWRRAPTLPSGEILTRPRRSASRRSPPQTARNGPRPFVEASVYGIRGQVAVVRRGVARGRHPPEAAAEVNRAAGRPALLAQNLSGVATAYTMAGDPQAAVPLATESLSIAHSVGIPTMITLSLSARGGVADRDPRQAELLLGESLQLRAALDYEEVHSVTQSALSAARMRRWPLILELASQSIRLLHWNADRPQARRAYSTSPPESSQPLTPRRRCTARSSPSSRQLDDSCS